MRSVHLAESYRCVRRRLRALAPRLALAPTRACRRLRCPAALNVVTVPPALVTAVPLTSKATQLGATCAPSRSAGLTALGPVAHPARAPVAAGKGPLPPAPVGTSGPAGFEIGEGTERRVVGAEVHGVVGDFTAEHADGKGGVSIGAGHQRILGTGQPHRIRGSPRGWGYSGFRRPPADVADAMVGKATRRG